MFLMMRRYYVDKLLKIKGLCKKFTQSQILMHENQEII